MEILLVPTRSQTWGNKICSYLLVLWLFIHDFIVCLVIFDCVLVIVQGNHLFRAEMNKIPSSREKFHFFFFWQIFAGTINLEPPTSQTNLNVWVSFSNREFKPNLQVLFRTSQILVHSHPEGPRLLCEKSAFGLPILCSFWTLVYISLTLPGCQSSNLPDSENDFSGFLIPFGVELLFSYYLISILMIFESCIFHQFVVVVVAFSE